MLSKTPHLIYFKTDGMRKELNLNDFSQLMCDFFFKNGYILFQIPLKEISKVT